MAPAVAVMDGNESGGGGLLAHERDAAAGLAAAHALATTLMTNGHEPGHERSIGASSALGPQ